MIEYDLKTTYINLIWKRKLWQVKKKNQEKWGNQQ